MVAAGRRQARPRGRRRWCALATIALALATRSSAAEQASDRFALFEQFAREGRTGPLVFPDTKQFVSMLDKDGTAWLNAAPPGEGERRRNVLAVLALETAATTVDPHEIDHHSGMAIVEWACSLLRRAPPTAFEEQWMVASNAVFPRSDLERTGVPAPDLDSHLHHALSRFPHDAALRLLDILTTRPESVLLTNGPGRNLDSLVKVPIDAELKSGPKGLDRIADTLQRLGALVNDSASGAEARLHLGILEFHLNQLSAAAADLEAAARTNDSFVRNLAGLTASLAFDAEHRGRDATAALRDAVAAAPTVRTSAVALAAHLALEGKREEASHVVDTAYGSLNGPLDPWRHIVAPERLLSERLPRLRELAAIPERPSTANPATATATAMPAPPPTVETGRSPQALADAMPTFRASTTAISLDVSVTQRHVPVDDLQASEFAVRDNGVPQRVSVNAAATPLDVTLVCSFFIKVGAGNQLGSTLTLGLLSPLVSSIQSVARTLPAQDRLRLIEADSSGSELFPLAFLKDHEIPSDSLPSDFLGDGRRRSGQGTYHRFDALYDSVASALLRPAPEGRRHVVIAYTDGEDSASVLTSQLLLAVARQADAVLYLIRRNTSGEDAKAIMMRDPRSFDGIVWTSDPRTIEDAATATGGSEYYSPHGDLVVDYREILDRFRKSYVISYQLTGVPPGGEHTVSIKINRPGNFEVKARPGYSDR